MKFRLCLMMFLQLFIWGAWFEIGFSYIPNKLLGFGDVNFELAKFTLQGEPYTIGIGGVSLIFWAFNIGALVAMFFSTQFADRYFAAEKFMAFSHVIGGAAMFGLYYIHPMAGEKGNFWAFFGLMLLHSVFYVPTISIANSIAFANLKDPAKEFGPVRVWGTIGWIAASWPFLFILSDWAKVPAFGDGPVNWLKEVLGNSKSGEAAFNAERNVFLVAGVASLVLALFSFALPHTPPKPATSAGGSLAWLKAMKLLKYPFVAVLFLVTFIDAAVHQSFFVYTPDYLVNSVGIPKSWSIPVMKIGQIAEILTMLILGWVLKSLGWRLTMTIGVLGHAARFAVFSYVSDPKVIVAVNALHGICYAFFFATVYIFVDEYFPKDVRSSAQGLFNVLIVGFGPVVGTLVSVYLLGKYTENKVTNYPAIFQYSMAAGVIGAIILFLFFHPKKPAESAT